MEELIFDETPPTAAKDTEQLLAFAANRDVPCPACGYNLRMLNQPTCPECGLPLKLTVGSDEAFKRAWAITLMLTAMIAGVGVFCIIGTLAEGFPSFYYTAETILYFGTILAVPFPIALLLARRWFCKLKKGVQYLAVVLSSIWMLVLMITLLSLFN